MTTSKSKQNLLIVDDDKLILLFLDTILKDYYNVYPARSGDEALKFVSSLIPDMILLDVNMPGMDGYQVISELQRKPSTKHIPVIFLTSMDNHDHEIKALKLGAVDYIRKPINRELVLARVSTQLELASYRKELAFMVEKQTNTIIKQSQAIINILARITEYRDIDTGNHINRSRDYVEAIINGIACDDPEYFISRDYADNIICAAPLHDIGKVITPDSILLKPGRLTYEEFEIMKLHTKAGYLLLEESIGDLEDVTMLTVAKDIAIAHHEHFDGTGYPYGTKGKSIPVPARIMAVADVFDALISKRPYKDAMDLTTARGIISEESGTHFDPIIVDAFMNSFDRITSISKN